MAPAANVGNPDRAPSSLLERPADEQATMAPAVSRRLAPPCWGDDETLALIEAYRKKWYEHRRGNLRASHWQEVADALRRRCPSSKTAVQCRHKVEKLRQRYRSEKQRLALRGKPRPSSWPFFAHVDSMELGTAPPPDPVGDSHRDGGGESKNASMPQLGFSGIEGDGLGFRVPRALRSKLIASNGAASKHKQVIAPTPKLSAVGEGKKKEGLVWEMAAAVKLLGEEFARVETMKMEMAKDVEKLRREMESKRTELIVRSHRQMVDYIHEKMSAES